MKGSWPTESSEPTDGDGYKSPPKIRHTNVFLSLDSKYWLGIKDKNDAFHGAILPPVPTGFRKQDFIAVFVN